MKESTNQKNTATRKTSGRTLTKSSPVKPKTQTKKPAVRGRSEAVKRQRKEDKKHFYQELLGLLFLGVGIFTLISLLSDKVGVLGDSIKQAMFAVLGLMAYVSPFVFLLMGTALIIRKPGLFSNKKTYGLLLVVVTTALVLSLNRMGDVQSQSFLGTLKKLMSLKDNNHGGILGLSMAIPLYKLVGVMGTYLFAAALYLLSVVLFFNTTIYDMLKKSNRARLQAKEEIRKRKAQTIEVKQLSKSTEEEKKIKEKLKILDMMNGEGILTNPESDAMVEPQIRPLTKSPFVNLDESKTLDRIITNEDENSKEAYIGEVDSTMEKEESPFDVDLKPQESKESEDEVKPKISSERRQQHDDFVETKGDQLEAVAYEKPQYEFPEIALLKQNIKGMLANEDRDEIVSRAKKLEETLMSFGVEARVINVSKGPSVTRYELQPKPGVKVSRIVNLSDDIALALAARGVRIEAPIPGKAAVGIEIPNRETTPVYLREVIEDKKFQNSTSKISVALGKDISGEVVIGDLSKMPHVLIAGATGSGKSVCINSLIISILYKYQPEQVRLLMVDPKVVELNVYNGIPHLLIPVVTDPKKAAGALNWAVNEMTRRYQSFADQGVRNIEGFNEMTKKKKELVALPYIVIIVDELADLMMVSANEVEDYIARLAQMARAAGMHLVLATQRPSVDVITGVIKANIPSRISFAVSSAIDSRTILDSGGAEKLLGKGDMLYYPVGEQKPKRIQGAFISEEEVEAIVSRIKVHKDQLSYDEDILYHIERGKDLGDTSESDELLADAVKVVVENQQASTSFLQRKMRIGYNRAARIMDELEERGVISGRDGTKPRQVLMSESELNDQDF